MGDATRGRLRSLLGSRWLWPAMALALAAVGFLEMWLRPGVTDPLLVGLALVLFCAPVAFAPRLPLAAACATALVIGLSSGIEGPVPEASMWAQAAVAYACGAYASGRVGALGAAVLLVTSEVLIGFPNGVFVPLVFAIIAPWWVGQQLRQRRRMVRELGARSRELEAEEDAFARLSVRRERARIARELHDIVAHHLAVIVIQAGAGRVADPNRMDEAAERFRSVREAGEQALGEMARLVDILHADDAHAPGTDRLQLLLESADANGLDVQVTPLPPGVQLPAEVEDAAYRVVQEGLTNVMKHAPGAEVEVRLFLRGDSFEIVVRNDGDNAPSLLAETGSGLGLTGMRERVESEGGTLDVGPDGDGWRLHARLPVADPALALAR